MKTDTYNIKLVTVVLFFFGIMTLSGILPQNSRGEEEEGEELKSLQEERMTKEGQAALVAASEALSDKDEDGKDKDPDFATAEKILVDYLATDPTYKPEILYAMLGVAYFNQEKYLEASNAFKEGFELFPEKTDFFTNQVQCLVSHAQINNDKEAFIESAKLFEKAYEILPEKDMENIKNAALCYYAAEELEEAKRVFLELYEMKSEPDIEILDTIYKICEELGQKDEMKKYLLVMMDYNPLRYEYWLLLAQMYSETSDYQNFASTLEIAYTLGTPEKSEFKNLISLYNFLNVPLRATKSLLKNSERFELDRDDDLRIINGYYVTNRVDKAASYIDDLMKKQKDTELMIQKANMLLEARKNEEAIQAADDIISFDPDQGNAYMIKGYAAWDMEDWELAKEAFEKATSFKDLKNTARYHISVIEHLEKAKADLEYAIAEAKAAKGETTEFSPAQ